MRTEIDEFIREEEQAARWCREEEYACECTECGRRVGGGWDMLGLLDADGNPVLLCEGCRDRMNVTEVLDLLGVRYYEGEATETEKAVTTWAVEYRRKHRVAV